MRTTTVTTEGIAIRATYSGGMYVELSFIDAALLAEGYHFPHPSVVIGIADLSKSTSDPSRYDPRIYETGGLRKIVREWIRDEVEYEPGVLRKYLANS